MSDTYRLVLRQNSATGKVLGTKGPYSTQAQALKAAESLRKKVGKGDFISVEKQRVNGVRGNPYPGPRTYRYAYMEKENEPWTDPDFPWALMVYDPATKTHPARQNVVWYYGSEDAAAEDLAEARRMISYKLPTIEIQRYITRRPNPTYHPTHLTHEECDARVRRALEGGGAIIGRKRYPENIPSGWTTPEDFPPLPTGARVNPSHPEITKKSDLGGETYYTLWTKSPHSDYYRIERTFMGHFIASSYWDDIQAKNREGGRTWHVFPQGYDPNDKSNPRHASWKVGDHVKVPQHHGHTGKIVKVSGEPPYESYLVRFGSGTEIRFSPEEIEPAPWARYNPSFEVVTYTLPIYWASYLINGDASGLQEGEQEEIDAWLESEGNPWMVDVGEPYFSHWNDATRLGGDVAEYTAHLPATKSNPKPPLTSAEKHVLELFAMGWLNRGGESGEPAIDLLERAGHPNKFGILDSLQAKGRIRIENLDFSEPMVYPSRIPGSK